VMPRENDNGSRPTVLASGWLCNGERSPGSGDEPMEAMRRTSWAPPSEIGARNHSVFVDVQLWQDKDGRRTYSCAYLAAVWQLLRLGMIRNDGASVVSPRTVDHFPQRWSELPAITRLRPTAAPFCAYRTTSVLPTRFLPVELAVRVVLDQVSSAPEVLDQLVDRGAREGVDVPTEVLERVEYVHFNDS
jgi:hypothetical protein